MFFGFKGTLHWQWYRLTEDLKYFRRNMLLLLMKKDTHSHSYSLQYERFGKVWYLRCVKFVRAFLLEMIMFFFKFPSVTLMGKGYCGQANWQPTCVSIKIMTPKGQIVGKVYIIETITADKGCKILRCTVYTNWSEKNKLPTLSVSPQNFNW